MILDLQFICWIILLFARSHFVPGITSFLIVPCVALLYYWSCSSNNATIFVKFPFRKI